MGNSDGNITVENNRLKNEMSKCGDVSKHLIFPSNFTDESKSRMFAQSLEKSFNSNLPQFFSTKVRGQVIAFPAVSYAKIPEVVDLRVEKTNNLAKAVEAKLEMKPEENNRKVEANGAQLKFGIDSILRQDSSEKSDKTSQSTHPNIESHSPAEKSQSRKSSTDFHEMKKKLNLEIPKTAFHDDFSSFKSKENPQNISFSRRRHTHNARHHPYSKSPIERSHSDPSQSPDPQFTLSREKVRGKSASPLMGPCSFSASPNPSVSHSTVNAIQSHRKPFELHSCSDLNENVQKLKELSPHILEPNFKPSTHFSFSKFHPTPKKSPAYGFSPGDSLLRPSVETQRLSLSENDEVFNEDSEQKQKVLASKNFEQILRQRNIGRVDGSASHPTSPNGITLMDQNKLGAMGFLPSLSQLPGPGLTGPPPPGLNFQAWQNLPPNCHPAMLRHIMNPYVYNQTAAAAMALSYFQTLKSVPTPGMILPENLQLSKSPSKPNFVFRTPENDLHSGSDKNGGPRKRRKWTRAVFSILQRRALEDSFKGQKYVAKPERRFLAERLGLTDAQVKIWFQNRRMKWRQEQKSKRSIGSEDMSPTSGEENFRPVHSQT